jgi:DNA polymerase-3 subunit gamma/tau
VAHQSLYRTYRPQRFEDVVGQSHVTRTLRNAVAENAVAHAYLFTGPRGTGKTTTARILAKALNCEKGPTPDFDDTCINCVEITEGRHPDVYELDAASRTGVDAVRDEIINKVSYASTRGGYKVYIIDEVHMLSTSAFNALLKTLEEPPSKTVFVLCTTHPHKVPETIHSRCQRFDFRRISAEDIVERLQYIADAEKIEVAPGALTLIAKHASGGMRDAISTLDQLAAFTGKNISIDDVEGLLGEVDAALLFEIADDIADRDLAECFRFVAKLAEAGVDVPEFVKSLIAHFRDLFVLATIGDGAGIVDTTDENLTKLASQATVFGRERLARLLDLLGQLSSDIRWAGDARLALEVALVRMARPQGDLTLEALEERICALESGALVCPPTSAVASSTPVAAVVEPEPDVEAPSKPAVPPRPAGPEKHAAGTGPMEPVPHAPEGVEAEAHVSRPQPAKPDASVDPGAMAAAVRSAARQALQAKGEQPRPKQTPAAAPTGQPTAPVEPAQVKAPARKGPLDRAQVKRAWPAVLAEVKKRKSSSGQMLAATAVDVDGDEVVVEFPQDEQISMKIAERPEELQRLRDAIANVLGVQAPVRYQLGRGVVQPAPKKEERKDPPPAAEEPSAEDDPPVQDAAPDGGGTPSAEEDPVDLLASEFGEVIVEHQEDTD